jgi:hypothetical protein
VTDIAFTIGTLVTDPAQYAEMRRSFDAGGFGSDDCEFLMIDNTCARQTSAYAGLNQVLHGARGRFVILCHQDVRLITDNRMTLEARLGDLEMRDPDWAVAGNAGGIAPGRLALRISDPHGSNRAIGTLPARVASLDENFLVVRRSARIGFSRDLDGFHFYGTDICLAADLAGWRSYVIDFHLRHLSPGRKSADFDAAEQAFVDKWGRALRPRWIQTTCSLVPISGEPVRRAIGRALARPYAGLRRRLPSAAGWTRPSA